MSTDVLDAPRFERGGWRIVAGKELSDHLRSVRLTILTVLMFVVGLGTVYAASGAIRESAEQTTGSVALFLRMFTASPSRVPAFTTLIALLGPLLGIAFGFDAVNGERSQGTLPRLVSQPIWRDDVINGKFAGALAVIGGALGAVIVFVAAIGYLRIGVEAGLGDIVRLLLWYVTCLVYVGFWLAFSTLCSVRMRRAATSALAVISTWLVLTLFAALLVGIVADLVAPVPDQPTVAEEVRNVKLQQTLSRLSPSTLFEETTAALLNPQVRSLGILFPEQVDRAIPNPLSLTQSVLIVWPQATWLVALTLLSFAAAYVSFMRQEVRA